MTEDYAAAWYALRTKLSRPPSRWRRLTRWARSVATRLNRSCRLIEWAKRRYPLADRGGPR